MGPWINSFVKNRNGTEKGYPRQGTCDKDGEYSYVFTECGNVWYSVRNSPMSRNNSICPRCGKTIKIVMPKKIGGTT